MKKNWQMKWMGLAACLLLGLFTVSCNKEKDENNIEHVTRHGIVDVGGASTSGLSVLSLCGESQVNNNGFDVDMPQEANMNVIMVTNATDDVVMLFRDKLDATIAINSQSTAMALVTMYPMFAPICMDDYDQLCSLIRSRESFGTLVNEVERSIARMNNIYDTTNNALFSALENVINDVAGDFEQEKSGVGSKNTIFGQNCDPLDVRNDWLDVLTFRVEGLWPSYFGTAKSPSGKSTELKVLTREDYGIWSLFLNPSEYGVETTYQASEVGPHTITLSCNNTLGKRDFYMHIAAEFLSVVGFSLESGGRGQANFLLDAVASAFEDGVSSSAYDRGAKGIWNVMWDIFVDYLKEKPTGVMAAFVKKLSPLKTAYDFIKATFNGFPRVKNYIQAPATITLTFERKPNGELGYGNEDEGDWVDLGLPSGLLWATRNVGASSPEDYGDYFAWGETQPKEVYSWNTYRYCNGDYNELTKYCNYYRYGYNGFTDNLTTLQPEDDAATVNWGGGARTPTIDEWDELIKHTTTQFTTINNVHGNLITGVNGNSLFLPAVGGHWGSSFLHATSHGYYWSSSLNMDYAYGAWYVCFVSDIQKNGNRCNGFAVRPVRSVRQK